LCLLWWRGDDYKLPHVKKVVKPSKIPEMHLEITRFEELRVMDVGSGEIGFYSFQLDDEDGQVHMMGADVKKLKYENGKQFNAQFLHSEEDMTFPGARVLAAEIIESFKLKELAPADYSGGAPVPGGSQSMAHPAINVPDTIDSPSHGQAVVEQARQGSKSPALDDDDGMLNLVMGLTGANRELLISDPMAEDRLNRFCDVLNEHLRKVNLKCTPLIPLASDEATYELWASEWLVQHGDLDVVNQVKLWQAFRSLRDGRAGESCTLEEVLYEYADLDAERHLREVFQLCVLQKQNVSLDLSSTLEQSGVTVTAGAIEEAQSAGAPPSETNAKVELSPEKPHLQFDSWLGATISPRKVSGIQAAAEISCDAFYKAFEASEPLLRALTREKLFSGTLSAGAGSCQVTSRCRTRFEASKVASIPLGNRTPLLSFDLDSKSSADHVLMSPQYPDTRKSARRFLATNKDQAAIHKMSEERLADWKDLVGNAVREHGMSQGQRGLFLGISAIYYAAKEAQIADRLVSRDEFLTAVQLRVERLMIEGGSDERAIANLTLVLVLVEHVLHKSAQLVCRRRWSVSGRDEFVATWSLGFFIRHVLHKGEASTTTQPPTFCRERKVKEKGHKRLRTMQSAVREVLRSNKEE